jgi:hypothetical protein
MRLPETKRTSSIEPQREPTWWTSAPALAEPRACTQFGLNTAQAEFALCERLLKIKKSAE